MADPGGGAGPGYERRERGRSRDEAGGALEECRGVVKFYNAAKGYGFVVPDGGRDVLVHEGVPNRALKDLDMIKHGTDSTVGS